MDAMFAHDDHQAGQDGVAPVWVWALLAAAAAAYATAAAAARRGPRGWRRRRIGAFLGGVLLLGWAVTPGTGPYPAGGFSAHMFQHLLIGMVAPLALVLSAPVTLLLRVLPPAGRRKVAAALHSLPATVLANPLAALFLSVGGLVAVYCTPLYEAAATRPWLHTLVHVHFFLAGYLFAWVIAGPDPAPRRPSVPARLVVLGVAVFAHATISQLLYAGAFTTADAPVADRRAGAELMYYGGDIAELLIAFALLATWRPRRPGPPTAPAVTPRRSRVTQR
ncbi:cytochrome c oxidase assembly protein [Catellatospora sp. NPDC049609]|uniref:cytochrome c oxidase assembly protein n=1 Tax=Catellatospora sp. NPDC049609 TaxID=3155505 RepID=UPI003443E22F